MKGTTHAAFGYAMGAGAAVLAGGSPWLIPAVGIISAATSAGPSSPDIDQTDEWRHVSSELGHPHWMGHRKGTHLVTLPPLVWWLARQTGDPSAVFAWTMIASGWWSHMVGDWLFGSKGVMFVPRIRVGRFVLLPEIRGYFTIPVPTLRRVRVGRHRISVLTLRTTFKGLPYNGRIEAAFRWASIGVGVWLTAGHPDLRPAFTYICNALQNTY